MRMGSVASLLLAAWAGAAAVRPAAGAEITDVASSFDEDNPFDLRVRVGYYHDEKSASIKREGEGPGQTDIVLFKDLLYAHTRDWMSLRIDVGIFQDLEVYGELPFIIRDQGEYRFDQSQGSGCVYPPAMNPTCVNATNSTTLNDGIVPMGGYDATNGGANFSSGSDLVFRGVKRGGSGLDLFDTINLGILWGPLSQKRDDTKPTWVVGLEGQISFGNVMKFDRAMPDANHGVSEGVHRLIARTAISHRFKWVEPFIGFWYMLPIARDDSLFTDYGPTQKNGAPQQSAGTVFGVEGVPWERADKQYKVAIDVRGRIEGKFDGRGYSEAWEMLASSPALSCTTDPGSAGDPMSPNYNPACDPSKNSMNMNTKYQGQPYTGLTTIENYGILGADASIVVQAGKYVRFNIGFQYTRDQSHFLTIDDVGKAFDPNQGNGCDTPIAGRVSRACEYNPAFRPVINEVGRRYKVDNVDNFRFGVWAQAMF
jgi:hypothetical protein